MSIRVTISLSFVLVLGFTLAACDEKMTGVSDEERFDLTIAVDCYVCTAENFGDSAAGTPYFATTGRPAKIQLQTGNDEGRVVEIDENSRVRARVPAGAYSILVDPPHGRATVFDSIYITSDTVVTLLVRRYFEYADSMYISFSYTVNPYYNALSQAEEHDIIHDILEQVGYVFDTMRMRRIVSDYPGARAVVYRSGKVTKQSLWMTAGQLSYALRNMAPDAINIYAYGYGYGLCPEDFKAWDSTGTPGDSVPPIVWPDTSFDSIIYPPD